VFWKASISYPAYRLLQKMTQLRRQFYPFWEIDSRPWGKYSITKISEFFENSEICICLHQHPHRIFQEPRERLHELGGFGTIADAVINGDGGFRAGANGELIGSVFLFFFFQSLFDKSQYIFQTCFFRYLDVLPG